MQLCHDEAGLDDFITVINKYNKLVKCIHRGRLNNLFLGNSFVSLKTCAF